QIRQPLEYSTREPEYFTRDSSTAPPHRHRIGIVVSAWSGSPIWTTAEKRNGGANHMSRKGIRLRQVTNARRPALNAIAQIQARTPRPFQTTASTTIFDAALSVAP